MPTEVPGFGRDVHKSAHVEHKAHICDAGGIKIQRLIERRSILPSRGVTRVHDARREARGGGIPQRRYNQAYRRARMGTGHACGWSDLEHGRHCCDSARVEAQKLVECSRVLPSENEGVRGRLKLCVCALRARCSTAEGQGTRVAYVEHVPHVCDARRVENQRFVKRPCDLPSRSRTHIWLKCQESQERAAGADGGANSCREDAHKTSSSCL